MKKHKILLLITLSSALLLSGCGKENKGKKEPEPAVKQVTQKAPETDKSLEETVQPEKEPEPEPDTDLPPEEGMVRSRITNEWVTAEVNNTRPITVMVPNTKTATQYSLSKADVLYECSVEGSITRLMALFQDWGSLDRIGNIRSCRDYYVYWSFEWDAFYIHCGGPFYTDDVLGRPDTDHIDGLSSSNFWQAQDAVSSGDNTFVNADGIRADIDRLHYNTAYRSGYADAQHYRFAPDNEPNMLTQYSNSITANKIDLSPAYPVTNCYFTYNSQTGLYDRFQHLSGTSAGPHMDMATGRQLAFKNILIQNTYYEVRDQKGYLAFQCHDTTRDGWFFTNGRGIHVTWEKTSDYGATRYYDDHGNEIQLNTGKTMICIVEEGDSFLVDNDRISP